MMTENQRRAAALRYLTKRHPLLALRIASSGPLDGLGDFWSNLVDKVTGSVSTAANTAVNNVTQQLQTAVSSNNTTAATQSTGFLSNLLGPSTATALYNIFRIQNGQQPVNVQDVAGVAPTANALNFLPWAIGGAALLWALSHFGRRR